MRTERLFYRDSHQTTCQAKVLACREVKKGYEILLDQTVFYPEGGGQPCDIGTMNRVEVMDVQEKDGEIWHRTREAIQEGTEVTCRIDWERRFDLMQQHSGEHLISGLIHEKYGYNNVGFHMGSETITLDVDGEVPEAVLKEIEAKANQYVWENHPIEITHPSEEELKTLPYRSKKELTGDVRIVTWPGMDICACCGVHVDFSGEIGQITLVSAQKFKGGMRIEMLCGKRALEYTNQLKEQNRRISQLLSAKWNDTADAVEKYGSDTLKLYNWGEYMGEDLISNFEKEFGVKVIVEYFDSNETMYTKLQAGDSYDVLVPSDYMIERLINEGMLQELDLSLIPNISNLAEGVKNLPYDPENTYSVPYFWGSVGIVYNHNNVDPAVVEEQGYSILHNTDYKGKIYVYDSERDSFMMAFKALGYSMNTDNQDEIQEAYQWLLDMNNTMEPVYVTDEVIDGMINGTKDIAVVYSGDATTILEENPDMSFWMPTEGTNLWSDAMVIPANAENPKLAHEFINYVLTYEASLGNSEYVGYASSNQEVLDELSGEGGLFADNEAYLPRAGYEKDEVFVDNQVLKKELAELWIKVKATK